LIGWGEESFNGQRTKYWIAANSWGKWFGESESQMISLNIYQLMN
jgi:hypothetical protein